MLIYGKLRCMYNYCYTGCFGLCKRQRRGSQQPYAHSQIYKKYPPDVGKRRPLLFGYWAGTYSMRFFSFHLSQPMPTHASVNQRMNSREAEEMRINYAKMNQWTKVQKQS